MSRSARAFWCSTNGMSPCMYSPLDHQPGQPTGFHCDRIECACVLPEATNVCWDRQRGWEHWKQLVSPSWNISVDFHECSRCWLKRNYMGFTLHYVHCNGCIVMGHLYGKTMYLSAGDLSCCCIFRRLFWWSDGDVNWFHYVALKPSETIFWSLRNIQHESPHEIRPMQKVCILTHVPKIRLL